MQNKNEQENYFQSIHPPVFSIGGQMSANAQTTTPFETVFDACKKACEEAWTAALPVANNCWQ